MRRTLTLLTIFGCIFHNTDNTCFGDDRVPPELAIIRAQPAVFRILTYGNIELRVPQRATVDNASLDREYTPTPGQLPAAKNRYYWSRISEQPDRYLKVSADVANKRLENELMGSGTGFVISREGIILTNAHVIGSPDSQPLPDDTNVLIQQVGPFVQDWIKSIATAVGGQPDADQMPALANSMLHWCGRNSMITGQFKEARLVLKFDRDNTRAIEKFKSGVDLAQLLREAPQPITVPLTVLAKGEPMPGKDVAVLKADLVRETREMLLKKTPNDLKGVEQFVAKDQNDKFICLPLARTGDVLPGVRVQAMGFPGIAFDPKVMNPSAEYRVSAQDGQVAQTKTMRGGWDALEMTANINHGDSGGPVIDSNGSVIGLNVAGPEGAAGHSLAVPIDVAWEMLRKLDIHPEPGPLTAKWIEGLKLYAAGKYEDAQSAFTFVADVQAGVRNADGTKSIGLNQNRLLSTKVNPYVNEMLGRCIQQLRDSSGHK